MGRLWKGCGRVAEGLRKGCGKVVEGLWKVAEGCGRLRDELREGCEMSYGKGRITEEGDPKRSPSLPLIDTVRKQVSGNCCQ